MSDLSGRISRLEAVVGNGGVADLQAEAARFGELQYDTAGTRCYLNAVGDTMTVIGGHGTVRYEVPGIDLRECV